MSTGIVLGDTGGRERTGEVPNCEPGDVPYCDVADGEVPYCAASGASCWLLGLKAIDLAAESSLKDVEPLESVGEPIGEYKISSS
jgi:hypothetical protein